MERTKYFSLMTHKLDSNCYWVDCVYKWCFVPLVNFVLLNLTFQKFDRQVPVHLEFFKPWFSF
ncbi:hypothetical protein ES705_16970 [subsurface metagenome]